ncbi:hypothetical protein L3X38_041679 [Prunus dulcis]|uniref:Uncharacterized protein n=1 Tax=Prunus dulcis TaxID=3755 RepID=A0AAD4UUT4_PRUDU|nr:hypothetical protein L3X38_041679 [Prunus dulcis]
MNFHTLMARNGGQRREIGAGEVRAKTGQNCLFSKAGAVANVGERPGRDAKAEPVPRNAITTLIRAHYVSTNSSQYDLSKNISHCAKISPGKKVTKIPLFQG